MIEAVFRTPDRFGLTRKRERKRLPDYNMKMALSDDRLRSKQHGEGREEPLLVKLRALGPTKLRINANI